MESKELNTVLENILERKRVAVAKCKENLSLRALIEECSEESNPPSFISAITIPNQVSIIAEMKKASPSAGVISNDYKPVEIAKVYERAGALSLSILTEEEFFQGNVEDLIQVKKETKLPILRKDFIVDPYQIYESKVIGASAILLIVAALTESSYMELIQVANKLEMDILVEIHNEEELKVALKGNPKLIGINNRNLKDLSVNLETTFQLSKLIPKNITIVSESGIQSTDTIKELKSIGVSAALVGESLLKSKEPAGLLRALVKAGK